MFGQNVLPQNFPIKERYKTVNDLLVTYDYDKDYLNLITYEFVSHERYFQNKIT